MNIELKQVTVNEKHILNNLMEKHIYEFSQYDLIPYNEEGLFNDPHLDSYFTDSDRFAYLIYADGKLAGLALVNKYPECDRPIDWAVAEFWISYHYRRKGVGTAVMDMLFEKFKGVWHIKYHPKNEVSHVFWNKIADKASGGNYETVRGKEDYFDGTPAKVLVFNTNF